MIDTKELRFAASKSVRDLALLPSEVIELLDRLEAAESTRRDDYQNWMTALDRNAELLAKLEAAEKTNREWLRANAPGGWIDNLRIENDTLRAKVEQMERQEPVGKFIQHPSNGLWEQDGYGDNPDARPLYALPGAKGEEK